MVPQLNHFASKIHEGERKVGLTKYVNWKLHKVDVFDCVHILNPTYHGLQLYLLGLIISFYIIIMSFKSFLAI